jgi:hypothetical protein
MIHKVANPKSHALYIFLKSLHNSIPKLEEIFLNSRKDIRWIDSLKN